MAFIPLNRVHWLYWLALLWCCVYLLLTLSWWQQYKHQELQLQQTAALLPWVEPVQTLIRNLQTERGLSAGQVTPSLPYKPALQIQYLLTDAAWRDLTVALEQQTAPAQSVLMKVLAQNPLPALRQQVLYNGLESTPVDGAIIIKAYSAVIKPLLQYVQQLQQDGDMPWQQHSNAISQLTEMIERSGLERAMLHMAMAEQEMSAARYQNYVFVMNELRDHQSAFEERSPAAVLQDWQQWQQQQHYQQLTEVREQALNQQFSVPPALWFSLSSTNINQLYQLQQDLQLQLQQDLTEGRQTRLEAMQQLQLHQQYMLLLLLLILWRMHRLNIITAKERPQPKSTVSFQQQIGQG